METTEARDRIIRAAVSVFAESGYRGATTRRIAQVAGVNEVTLFRHFGSKDELLQEAVSWAAMAVPLPSLPAEPVDPEAELTSFSREHLSQLHRARSLIRVCLGEVTERPEFLSHVKPRPVAVRDVLRRYLVRMRERGMANAAVDVDAAATMLVGVLFADAMGRDAIPELYTYSVEEAPARYVRLLLDAIGARPGEGSGPDNGEA